ncbi:MAG: ATP synthase F1 subunit delta [Muribaculaceae bacterium]|jgi:F-type H+-transporting ATPase subunit delta|nr:ATP synthase F1 subunit delta [Muribaculaceae bacterium]MEE1338553.1 ATP synthase F1 subunit delta [Muribaculaceae bacterium]
MNDGLIPNRYAKALYKFAIEEKASEEVYLQMKRLSESYEALPELKKTVDNPFLPVADREKVLLSASGAEKDGCLDKFILMVIKNNRESSMREMALSYGKIYREANNIAQVNIVTATQLPDDKLSQIIEVVQHQLEGKTIERTVTVDKDLIGGFTVQVDSMVLDASIKNELKKLRLKLLKR